MKMFSKWQTHLQRFHQKVHLPPITSGINFFVLFFIFNTAHKYHSRNEFLHDIELILKNCIVYNGRDSSYSERAEALLKTAQSMMAEVDYKLFNYSFFVSNILYRIFFLVQYDEHLTTWEQKIKLVQERAKSRTLSESWFGGDDDQIQEVSGIFILKFFYFLFLSLEMKQ